MRHAADFIKGKADIVGSLSYALGPGENLESLKVERATSLELATYSLGSCRSTD